jgi:GH15 family glucan-1,4-alpha-glucosidase
VNRIDGFVPIAEYAALGDGRTVALVARDGAIDWLPVPAVDGAPVFGALLDPERGGTFSLRPVGEFDAARRYLPETNILETTYKTEDGVVTVTEGLMLQDGGMLSWTELARRVDGVQGTVRLGYELRPRFEFARVETRIERREKALVARAGTALLSFRIWGAEDPTYTADTIAGALEVGKGDRALLACTIVDGEPIPLPPREEIDVRIDRTGDAWRRWATFHERKTPWPDAVSRSALALKLLIAANTGAIAAAPTTSLPERIGGDLNWDYRFSWVRDSALTLDSLGNLGYSEQVHESLSWLLDATEKTHPKLKPFYTLEGDEPGRAEELDDVAGYRGSRPVRRGNQAGKQRQLGAYGDLLETVCLYVEHGNTLDEKTGCRMAEVADYVCKEWRKEDSGIWELTREEQFTVSKIHCWVALDRALRLADLGEVPRDHADRWREERESIHAWVDEHCWSDAKETYVLHEGTEDLDAAVLLGARVGFLAPDDPRLHSTIDAIRRELGAGGPLLYRYTGQDAFEGAFLACSFWLVTALARCGRIDEARDTMEQMLELSNDVGLYAEELDPKTQEQLGNFPQGLTHLSLIIAATAVAAAERAAD